MLGRATLKKPVPDFVPKCYAWPKSGCDLKSIEQVGSRCAGGNGFGLRDVVVEGRIRLREELDKALLRRWNICYIGDRSDQPYQCPVGSPLGDGIPKYEPFDQVLVGHRASTLHKEVVDQQALLAHRDQNTIDFEG